MQLYKQYSNLKTNYNTLLLENKSLKGELLNFRNVHNQVCKTKMYQITNFYCAK